MFHKLMASLDHGAEATGAPDSRQQNQTPRSLRAMRPMRTHDEIASTLEESPARQSIATGRTKYGVRSLARPRERWATVRCSWPSSALRLAFPQVARNGLGGDADVHLGADAM